MYQPSNNVITKDHPKTYQHKQAKASLDSVKKKKLGSKNKIRSFTIKNTQYQKFTVAGKLKISSDYIIIKNSQKNSAAIFKNKNDSTKNIVQNENKEFGIQNFSDTKLLDNDNKPDSIVNQNNKTSDKMIGNVIKNDTNKNEMRINTSDTKIKTSNKYSWSWGFSFSAGISGMANSIFGSQEKSLLASQYSNSTPGSNPITTAYFTPSFIKPSIALVTGISTKRNITSKIIFVSGVSYKLFSTTNGVGKDSVNYFRANNTDKTYHNYYHYLEFPVDFKLQITNSKKTQLYWSTGFSISQLISTNALQFNNTAGLYYHDNSLFNKTQIGFTTGIDIAFLQHKGLIIIGPYLNYGITKIANQGYNKHHFTFIGLRTQFFLRKK